MSGKVSEMLAGSFVHYSTITVETPVLASVSMLTLVWRSKLRPRSTSSPNRGLQEMRFTVNRGLEVHSHCPLEFIHLRVDIIWDVYG